MPRARLWPTAAARMRGVLRRPLSPSQLCVVRVPWTMTGSPLLTLPDTLPDRSFQHSTSTQKVPASTNCWVWASKRRAVDASRKLVTAPFSRLTRRGEAAAVRGRRQREVGARAVLKADAAGRVDDVADDGDVGVVHGAPQGLSAGTGGGRRGAGTPRTLGADPPPRGPRPRSVDSPAACGR